jgi:uncharacterized peroxidase-related enzyme
MALEQIEWSDKALLEPISNLILEKEIKKIYYGSVPRVYPYLFHLPYLAKLRILFDTYPVIHLSDDLILLVSFVVVQEHSCRYCYGATRSLMKLLGYDEDYIRKIEEDINRADISDNEKIVLEFARKVSRCNPRIRKEDIDILRNAGFDNNFITELIFYVSIFCFETRLTTPLAIPPDQLEELEKNIIVKIFRPLVAFVIKKFKPYRETEPFPSDNTGPFSEVINLLKNVPTAASTLRKIIDNVWESDILSKRSKALIFAIIARTLGCKTSEDESCRLLESEGLTNSDINDILTHLDFNKLTPFESGLIIFARETVRYKPYQIQSKLREFSIGLSGELILEMLAVMGLANSIARMSILLDNR